MVTRRTFIRTLSAVAAAAPLGVSALRAQAGDRFSAGRPLVIDGLGEIRLDYEPALLDEIRASGLRGCVVTMGNPALHDPAEALADIEQEIAAYDAHIAAMPGRLARATSVGELEQAAARDEIALVYYIQNATAISDDVQRLDVLYRLGVRIVQLTYNTRNLLGDGCLERTNAGLSRFGVEVVERMHELKMLVDVSHSGDATTLDAITLAKRPVAITHAGCKAVFDHPRNKTDEALRALADRGGVIGIFQINPYLGPNERNTLEDFLRHVDHAIDVAGIDHVGIGSDREHRVIPDTLEEKQRLVDELSRLRPVTAATVRWPFFISELNGPRRMDVIREALTKRGRSAVDVDKVLGGNFLRLFRDTIGG